MKANNCKCSILWQKCKVLHPKIWLWDLHLRMGLEEVTIWFWYFILSLSNDCYLFFALGNSLLESRYLISKCKMVMKVAMTGLFAFWDKRFDGIGVGIKLVSLSQRISCIEMDIFVYLIYVSLVCRFHYHLQSFRNSFESHYSHVEGRGCTSAW